MHKKTSTAPEPDVLRQLGYEPRDVAFGSIVRWIIALFIFIGVAAFIALVLHLVWVGPKAETQQSAPQTTVRQYPPDPRLQAQPVRDMREFRQRENERLESEGWVNRDRGIVHMPVERAIELLAERGLRSRAPTTSGRQPMVFLNSGDVYPDPLLHHPGIMPPSGYAPDPAETGAEPVSGPVSPPAVPDSASSPALPAGAPSPANSTHGSTAR